jgi:hypothetical protein
MILFDNRKRTNTKYKEPGKRLFTFLNDRALPEFEAVRTKLNDWFKHYPEKEQFELKKRFQSRDQFYDTFFELYILEFFYRKVFQIRVHPNIRFK